MNSESVLEIDLNRTYNAKEVQSMIDIILEEADIAIEHSYKEGYKQATVEFKPELEYWKERYESLNTSLWKKNLTYSLVSFGIGCGVGALGVFCITYRFN